MEAWLSHPGFQSAVAPLAVALVVALAAARFRLSGLAVAAGTLVCIELALGLDLVPLNATRRIVLVLLLATVAAVVLDLVASARRTPAWAPALVGAGAIVWVTFRALSHRDAAEAWALGAGLAVYCAVVAFAFDRLSARPARSGAAALGIGLSTGVAATLSASASLGQIGLAIGAAAGGYLLVALARSGDVAAGRALTLPTSLTAALLSAAAVVLAKLPWFALPLFAAIPLVAAAPIAPRAGPRLEIVVHGAVAVAVGAFAVAVVWATGAETSSSGY